MTVKGKTPSQFLQTWFGGMKKEYKIAFVSAFLTGILIHMPVLVSDIPNHDGLSSLYFDQNMITSGRWFLTVACGFSSYFTLPWMIGLLGMFFLSCSAVALTELLELRDGVSIVLVSGLLTSFPALASTFAYFFTMDGYMLALLLAVLAVLLTKKRRYGFVAGAICLACSLGTYQAYLPFAILLCLYEILELCMEERAVKEKIGSALRYLYMGVLGGALYYVILRILLLIQGKELASYQGINGMDPGKGIAIKDTMLNIYRDFVSFSFHGNVLFNNGFSVAALVVLVISALFVAGELCVSEKWWKRWEFYAVLMLTILALPFGTNVILCVSPNVTYHLLMRYQWVVYPILLTAFVSRHAKGQKSGIAAQWGAVIAAFVLVFNYAVTDNIGYSNLQKRYEKTYAYCVRLLDRIEQTEGYYKGIPIAMVGVVGDDPYPVTDITLSVTSNMIGLNGDTLLYTGDNYQKFMQNYLGATLNILPPEEMKEIYYSEEYVEMESFPGPSSVKIVNGILYVKTENKERD